MDEYSIPRKLYNFFIKRWLVSVIILTLPSYYLILVRTLGGDLGLVYTTGALTYWGGFVFWPLFVISIGFAVIKTYGDKYNEQIKYNGQFVLQKMLSSVNAIKSKKLQRSKLNPFHDITQPKRQIESVLENIQICLSEIFDINREDIGLSIIYKFDTPGNSNYRYLHTMNINNDLSLKELITNQNTTARQIIDGRSQSLFFPDKRIGDKSKQFVPGLKDKPFSNIGSIICRDISIDNEERYVFAVLSITTYGKQICEVDDLYSIKRVENVLLPTFENRIRLELSLLYIKNVLANQY